MRSPLSTCCSKKCVPGGYRKTWHTKWSGIMMTATNLSTGSSRAMRLEFRTSPRKASSNQCLSNLVDLQSRLNSNKRGRYRKWYARCSGTGFRGILLIDFLSRGETMNADRYCETLPKLRRAIQSKRRGILSAGVVLLHDNTRPSWRNLAGSCLIMHYPVLILLLAIFTFSCNLWNSCPPMSVLATT